MFYIPIEWLKDKNNSEKVHEILNENLYTDLNISNNINNAIQKLNDIGETTIIEKLQDGTIVFT